MFNWLIKNNQKLITFVRKVLLFIKQLEIYFFST